MALVRSERAAAALLVLAALAGLLVANSPLAQPVWSFVGIHLAVPFTSLDLSIEHWISEGLLAVFFFVAAVELRHELTSGHLRSPRRAVAPALAALGGVAAPVVIYLAIAGGPGYADGWPVPTATDIAFALGVLAVFGRGVPARLRVFVLALAILDDVVAITIIAVLFTDDPRIVHLLFAGAALAGWAIVSRLPIPRVVRVPVLVALALLVWAFVHFSGVHATIAGVALGLTMAPSAGDRMRHRLEPFTNLAVLPLFAFTAALVPLPRVALGELTPAFWGIVIALPLGKIVGVAIGGFVARLVAGKATGLRILELVTAGALAGIGFTVSLLMNELAFDDPGVADEGTLAVLAGSGVSVLIAATLVSALAASHRRRAARPREAASEVELEAAPDRGRTG